MCLHIVRVVTSFTRNESILSAKQTIYKQNRTTSERKKNRVACKFERNNKNKQHQPTNKLKTKRLDVGFFLLFSSHSSIDNHKIFPLCDVRFALLLLAMPKRVVRFPYIFFIGVHLLVCLQFSDHVCL